MQNSVATARQLMELEPSCPVDSARFATSFKRSVDSATIFAAKQCQTAGKAIWKPSNGQAHPGVQRLPTENCKASSFCYFWNPQRPNLRLVNPPPQTDSVPEERRFFSGAGGFPGAQKEVRLVQAACPKTVVMAHMLSQL